MTGFDNHGMVNSAKVRAGYTGSPRSGSVFWGRLLGVKVESNYHFEFFYSRGEYHWIQRFKGSQAFRSLGVHGLPPTVRYLKNDGASQTPLDISAFKISPRNIKGGLFLTSHQLSKT
jgi:hypothetical protein